MNCAADHMSDSSYLLIDLPFLTLGNRFITQRCPKRMKYLAKGVYVARWHRRASREEFFNEGLFLRTTTLLAISMSNPFPLVGSLGDN